MNRWEDGAKPTEPQCVGEPTGKKQTTKNTGDRRDVTGKKRGAAASRG